ncbi:pyocin knob domain-containing protein [Bacteroides sp. KH569_7]|uniref:Pyocin knob domain-containing protein n=1 Tax=Bacteroides muris (ex Fokt et al. 2023) TaxID=2937417 RepID=A0A9X2SYL1_9BACE|nr:pyocin knob domain-containing protein [Bacteroides muris (ex Fokt et al. 2023)]MCR6510045.1 pyocin knob domain-containing protein [Bacteroides muris (ex Fokt et al. 2023)]
MASDIKMNSFAQATDAAYIYAEAANGSQVKIKKEDLLGALFRDRGQFEGDANELKTAGMYYVTGNTKNIPSGYYGLMLVFKSVAGIAQIVYSVSGYPSKERVLLYNGGNWDTWSNWA